MFTNRKISSLPKTVSHPELDETECSDDNAYFDMLDEEGLLEYYAQTRYERD